MPRLLIAGLLGAAGLALVAPDARACGDKLLRVGRGSRFERGYVALHPAAVLVFVNGTSAAAKAMGDLQPALKGAGHRPTVVRGETELGKAIQKGKYDVVLAADADVGSVKQQLGSAGVSPEILPVLNKPTKQALAEAEKAHACVVENPGKRSEVLIKIDQVLEAKK